MTIALGADERAKSDLLANVRCFHHQTNMKWNVEQIVNFCRIKLPNFAKIYLTDPRRLLKIQKHYSHNIFGKTSSFRVSLYWVN